MSKAPAVDPLAAALAWIEDVEPDGDEDAGQTGWFKTGGFFVPAPARDHLDTVEYIDPGKIAAFVLWAREEIVRLRDVAKARGEAIEEIWAKATPYGSGKIEAGEEWVDKYLMPAGPLHRAKGLLEGGGWKGRQVGAPTEAAS
jgi:hypothetical protein